MVPHASKTSKIKQSTEEKKNLLFPAKKAVRRSLNHDDVAQGEFWRPFFPFPRFELQRQVEPTVMQPRSPRNDNRENDPRDRAKNKNRGIVRK